ncbi:MAG: T9SS type A sorting domain-containing protein [Ignavibacteriales bacterium]|nr:T9SS type A sorting domain-containing protein [Ignavibacteriales bacterium]
MILRVGVGIWPIRSEIKNNVIAYCGEAAIQFSIPAHAQNCDINYNLFYQNRKISYDLSIFDPDTTIYYTSDPMFENQDSNNFLLQMFSPLIDAGDPNILDVDGSRSDVGLYGGPYGQSYQYRDLPPKKPKVISATKLKNKVNFHWRGGTEADFNSFSLYRNRDPLFSPSDNNKIYSGIDTIFTDSLTDPTGSYSYKLTARDNQGNVSKLDSVTVVITGITNEEESPTPETIYLYQNYPNPFNPTTKIKFSLTEESEVILRVYDVNGAIVAILNNGWLPAGEHERDFTPGKVGSMDDIASGVYFYNLTVRDENLKPVFIKSDKMMFLK